MRKILLFIFTVTVGLVGYSAYLFFMEISSGFPALPQGVYVGQMELAGNNGRLFAWMIVRRSGSSDTLVAVADEGFSAQRLAKALTDSADLPLIIDSPTARYRLVGRKGAADSYSGEVFNPLTQEYGVWSLKRIQVSELSAQQEKELQAWAEVSIELERVAAKLEHTLQESQQQSARLEKIRNFVSEGGALKQKASVRLDSATEAIEAERAEVKKLQEQLDNALRDIELSERVSPRGRLVQMSRESIAREARWIGASLQVGASASNPEYQKRLAKAIKVKALKEEIAAERLKLSQIESTRRYAGEAASTDDETSFYQNFR